MKRFAPLLLLSLLGFSHTARAQYAPPPYPRERYDDHGWESPQERAAPAHSTVRLLTGPAIRLGGGSTRAGLLAGADIGSGAAGLRVSGTWIGTGTPSGLSLYAAELWIDFGKESALRPIVAAGAALGRADRQRAGGSASDVDTASIGVALLRATLQYRLPVDGVDARAGIDLAANVRAFGPEGYTNAAWAMAAATVGIGF